MRLLQRHSIGNTALLAAISLVIVGWLLVVSEVSVLKASSNQVNANTIANAGASQAAVAALADGVTWVNNLTAKPTYCSTGTGCGTGVYNTGALSGGASAQSTAWWSTSSNVHAYSGHFGGVTTQPSYVVELTGCNTTSGVSTYKVTARGTAGSQTTGFQNRNVVYLTKTLSKTWAATNVIFYDYSCDETAITFLPTIQSFTAGAAGNFTSSTVTLSSQPYSSTPFTAGVGTINQIAVGAGDWSLGTSMTIQVSVNGSQVYNNTLSSPSMSNQGPLTACQSGNNMSVFDLSSNPITNISMGQNVQITFLNCTVPGCQMWYTPTQLRYRVLGTQATCP